MVLGAGLALLLLAAPQERVTSEDQAVRIADSFREMAATGANGAYAGEAPGTLLSVALNPDTLRYDIHYTDGWVKVRASDGRVAAHWLRDFRYVERTAKWELDDDAIQRAQAKLLRVLAFVGYTEMTAVFGKTSAGKGDEAMTVSYRPVWRGLKYPGTEWRHAAFDSTGERLVRFNLTGLSRPPASTETTVSEAEAKRTMLAKMLEVYGTDAWTLARIEPVVFRVRPERKPHILESHGWGWETGPPSIVAWEGEFRGPEAPPTPLDRLWTVHAWLDAESGAVLEMLSVRSGTAKVWRPPTQ
ncbi:MAG: hypothetical protein AB7F50_05505 [Fimbriimonadaceae bacterium]